MQLKPQMNTDEHREEGVAKATGVTYPMKRSLLEKLCCNQASPSSTTVAGIGSPLGRQFNHEEHEVLKRSDRWLSLRALRGENRFVAVRAESICGFFFLLTSNRKI
jgi:hypothetical protein